MRFFLKNYVYPSDVLGYQTSLHLVLVSQSGLFIKLCSIDISWQISKIDNVFLSPLHFMIIVWTYFVHRLFGNFMLSLQSIISPLRKPRRGGIKDRKVGNLKKKMQITFRKTTFTPPPVCVTIHLFCPPIQTL